MMNATSKKKRRTHYKSRRGCSECKRRHVKCDEQRPICLQCSTLGQQCSYAYLDPYGGGGGTSSLSAGSLSLSPSSHAATTEQQSCSLPQIDPQIQSAAAQQQAPRQVYELSHLALLHHVETELTKPPHSHLVPADGKDGDALVRLMVTSALSSPFLMDELLAFAAAHKSVLTSDPTAQEQYREQSAHLQARALALFNAAPPDVTEDNCKALFFFSSFIGLHMLFDIVTTPQLGLRDLLERFIHFAGVYRGVGLTTRPAWHVIRDSELSCIINLIETVDKLNLPDENTCDDLVARLVAAEDRLGPSSYGACYDAVAILQWIFKQHRALPDPINRQVVLAWPVRISQEYLDLLRNRQPEALVVMAYWALLLHRGRDYWIFGRGGRSLFDAIDGSLDPYWSEWLSFPRQFMASD